jgi:hypothetical protein
MFAANFGMSIMDNGYGMLISMMGYKLKEQGKRWRESIVVPQLEVV